MAQVTDIARQILSGCAEDYNALRPKKIPPGWAQWEIHGMYLAAPEAGLTRLQARTLAALVKYGRLKTRQWVEVNGDEFFIMPRHFRDFVLIAALNKHLIADTSKGRQWFYTWLPKAALLAYTDAQKLAKLEALSSEVKKEALATPFRTKKKKPRQITADRAQFLANSYWARATIAVNEKQRRYWLYMHHKMKQLKQKILREEIAKGLENNVSQTGSPAPSGAPETT